MPNPTDASFPRVNQEGKIIGFGVVDNTNMATASPIAALKTVYLTVGNSCITRFNGSDTVRNFCASDDNPGSTNLCYGDAGSAFVITLRGSKVLVS